MLPLKNLVPMLTAGLIFQACASGRFAFAAAAWMCLVSLATLSRTASLPLFLGTSFAVVWLGRLVGWHGVLAEDGAVVAGADVVVASAVAAGLTVLCLLCHRIAVRELPTAGPQALACAVVVVEWAAARFGLPGASLLPLWTSQPGDVPFWRWVDVISPAGITFAVAWTQGVLASFGEAWLAEDPYPQKVRERGLRIVANACFWSVLVVGHFGGFFRGDVAAVDTAARGDVVTAACAVALAAILVAAVVARLRRPKPTPPPETAQATPA